MSIKEIQSAIKEKFPIKKMLGLNGFKVAKGKLHYFPFRSRVKHHYKTHYKTL